MKNREFDIEDAYQIFVLFMQYFWWNFLKHIMYEKGLITEKLLTTSELESACSEDKEKNELFKANDFIFVTIPGALYGCGSYLEKIIEKRLHIPNARQLENLKIKEEILFQLIIDYCNYFNKRFKGPPEDFPLNSIHFAIEWLEAMLKFPEKHQKEWDMWNELINDVIIGGYKSSATFRAL